MFGVLSVATLAGELTNVVLGNVFLGVAPGSAGIGAWTNKRAFEQPIVFSLSMCLYNLDHKTTHGYIERVDIEKERERNRETKVAVVFDCYYTVYNSVEKEKEREGKQKLVRQTMVKKNRRGKL